MHAVHDKLGTSGKHCCIDATFSSSRHVLCIHLAHERVRIHPLWIGICSAATVNLNTIRNRCSNIKGKIESHTSTCRYLRHWKQTSQSQNIQELSLLVVWVVIAFVLRCDVFPRVRFLPAKMRHTEKLMCVKRQKGASTSYTKQRIWNSSKDKKVTLKSHRVLAAIARRNRRQTDRNRHVHQRVPLPVNRGGPPTSRRRPHPLRIRKSSSTSHFFR